MSRHLDDVEEERFRRTSLHGDGAVELFGRVPLRSLELRSSDRIMQWSSVVNERAMSLDGSYRLASCLPPDRSDEAVLNDPFFSQQFGEGLTSGWHLPEADRDDWLTVSLPGTVQRVLVDAGVVPDPLDGANTMDELQAHGKPGDVPWPLRKTRIEQREWWFARTFRLPEDWPGNEVELGFDGIDYAATVYLNGESLGYHAGMFGGPHLDVTHLLRRNDDNHLVIRLHPVPSHWYGVLKGSPGWGWHYGHLISTGVWRPVRIREVAPVELHHPFVSTTELIHSAARVRIEFDLKSALPHPQVGQVAIEVRSPDGVTVASLTGDVAFDHGTSRFTTEIDIVDPAVWWPFGYGNQPMYEARLEVATAESRHQTSCTFGVRTITMDPIEGITGEESYRWRFVVNGRPMFIKGANWCWTDPFLAEPLNERVFELTRRAGIQMLRAWGGGIVESDEFYDACDRAGILVYQEFPLSFGPHDAPLTDLAVVDRQSLQILRRLRNHPSLVMWGGGNENPASGGADEALTIIGRRCRQHDRSRPFHRTDPWGGSVHNYEVYHYGAPMDAAYLERPSVMYGEWGSPSVPRLENFRKSVGAAIDHWPPSSSDRAVLAHMPQLALNDFAKLLRYTDYGPIRDWATFACYTQLVQADNHRFVAERQRAKSARTSGFWFYKMTELFPGVSWGVIDFHGAPKRGYFTAARFCRPVHAFATYERYEWAVGTRFTARCHLSNDSASPLGPTQAMATVFDSTLQATEHLIFSTDLLPAGTTVELGTVSFEVSETDTPFFLNLRLADDVTGGSWYWFNMKRQSSRLAQLSAPAPSEIPDEVIPELFAVCAAPDLPSPLSRLPQATVYATARPSGPQNFKIALENRSDVPALSLVLEDGGDGTAELLSDNYLFLAPSESRTLSIELGREQHIEQFAVSGWNVEHTPVLEATT